MSLSNRKALEATLGAEILALRQRCLDDPIFLGAEVLNYTLLRTPAVFHLDAAEALKSNQEFLILAPRGHIKTTLCTIVGTIHFLLQDPNHRVLIVCAARQNAVKALREITWHFKNNPVFRALWPEYAVDGRQEEGAENRFDVPCRTGPAKDYSIEAIGIGGSITGGHFDRIVGTDMVTEKNVEPWSTAEQMEKVWAFFKTFTPLLDHTNPNAHRIIEGTRWHDGDMYGNIIREPGYAHFKQIIYSCWLDEAKTLPLWPEVFPAEKLRQLRAESGSFLWAANYENNPLPGDSVASFKEAWFRLYDQTPPDLDIAITVDLAISEKLTADRTAIVVTGVDPTGDFYVLHAEAGRWTPYQVVDRLYLLDAMFKPNWIGVESVAYQKAMIYMLDREAVERGVRLPVVELKPDGSKERRAAALQFLAEMRGIYVRAGMEDFIHEFTRFPFGLHDDYVDATAYRAQKMLPYVPQRQRAKPAYDLMSRFQILGSDVIKEIHKGTSGNFLELRT